MKFDQDEIKGVNFSDCAFRIREAAEYFESKVIDSEAAVNRIEEIKTQLSRIEKALKKISG